jgi:fatty acid desaturase
VENIFTIVAALVLAIFALLTAVFGKSLDKDETSLYRLVMVVLTVGSVWGAFCLSYPERHMDDLKYYGENAWWVVFWVVLAKAVLDFVSDGRKIKLGHILEVIGICALTGSVGTKAKDLTTAGAQPDLQAANIWLAIIGYACLLFLVFSGITKQRKQAAVTKQCNESRQFPQMVVPPMACVNNAKHMREAHPQHANTPGTTSGPFVITDAASPAPGPDLKKKL